MMALSVMSAGAASLVTGCFKDLGNYDYTEINEAVIGDKGFGSVYNIRINETLSIEPEYRSPSTARAPETIHTNGWPWDRPCSGANASLSVRKGTWTIR